MGHIDVWTIHSERRVLVDDEPGVPVAITRVIDPDDYAKKGATVSNIGFAKDDHQSFDDWDAARKFADEKAKTLGYTVEVHSIFEPWADPGDDDDWDDDDDVDDYWAENEY